jgi:hypothetical protein
MNPRRIAAAIVGAEIVLAASFGVAGGFHTMTGTAYASGPYNECEYEDGNTDGTSCTWQDPDSGRWYAVDSENYR